jgi:transposase
MSEGSEAFVGLDTSKTKISVAVADGGRCGEVRFYGDIDSSPDAVNRLVKKLSAKYQCLHFCYEAGPCGYGLHRQLTALGHQCDVVAPSMIPIRPGDRIKTNRRDAITLARLHRAGELTPVWVPDEAHEAVRDLVRAREGAMLDLRMKRQQLFLLRHDRIFPGRKTWSRAHVRWLCEQRFDHPAHQIVMQEYRHTIDDAETRLDRLEGQLADVVPQWSMAPVVEAFQAMRGVGFLAAVVFVAEVGDGSRARRS